MATFSYRGRDQGGKLISGVLDAASYESVANQLLDKGVTPIDIRERVTAKPFVLDDYFQPKIKLEELIMFSRQMYSLTRSGVVLNQAMAGLAASIKNPRMQKVLKDMEVGLNSGNELAACMRKHSDIFNDLFISIIQVGENSGRLDLAFEQLSQYMELEKETRRRVVSAVRYPLFVVVAISLAVVFLNIFVIPQFVDLFEKFNADLPLPTLILIGSSNLFVNHWQTMLVMLVLLIFGIRYYVGTEEGGLNWDRLKLKIPLIGDILERTFLARFGRTFALMVKSGVPLIQALELSAQAINNKFLAEKVRGMRIGIQRGDSLLNTASQSEMFTPLVLQMIQVGEQTGKVDELLEEVALFYEQEVDYDLKNLSSYIEPILIAVIAGIVALLALGIFLPMWDMFSVVQGG